MVEPSFLVGPPCSKNQGERGQASLALIDPPEGTYTNKESGAAPAANASENERGLRPRPDHISERSAGLAYFALARARVRVTLVGALGCRSLWHHLQRPLGRMSP